MTGPKFDKKTRAELKRAAKAAKTAERRREIADKFGCSLNLVRYYAKA